MLTETATTLMEEAFSKLEAIKTIKRTQITNFFKSTLASSVHQLKNTPLTAHALEEFAQAFAAEGGCMRR